MDLNTLPPTHKPDDPPRIRSRRRGFTMLAIGLGLLIPLTIERIATNRYCATQTACIDVFGLIAYPLLVVAGFITLVGLLQMLPAPESPTDLDS